MKNPHAVALGIKGGSSTSEAKKAAARKNWKKALKALAEQRAKNNHK
jgi:hypothetical protein